MRIPFLFKGQGRGRIGIEMGGNKVAIAHVVGDALKHCAFEFADDPEEKKAFIRNFISEHDLRGLPCTIVIHPRCYQMVLTDVPEVEEAELSAALPWKVKDLLHYPVEDVVIEHFLLPDDAFNRRQKMLYVCASPAQPLHQMADIVEDCDLVLDSIDITELPILAGVCSGKDPNKNVAVLYMDSRQGVLCVGQQQSLYLSRGLDVGLDNVVPTLNNLAETAGYATDNPQDTLLLEMQRSLDYYETQHGKGTVSDLYCLPMGSGQAVMMSFLQEHLSQEVHAVELGDFFELDGPFTPEENQHCLLAALAVKRWQYHGGNGLSMTE